MSNAGGCCKQVPQCVPEKVGSAHCGQREEVYHGNEAAQALQSGACGFKRSGFTAGASQSGQGKRCLSQACNLVTGLI